MEIKTGVDGDVVVLDLIGNFVASTAEDFKAQISKLSNKKFIHILVNMKKVNFMDSSGLGACIGVHKTITELKGLLVFSQPTASVNKIFRITKADQRLKISTSLSEGLRALHEKMIKDKKQG